MLTVITLLAARVDIHDFEEHSEAQRISESRGHDESLLLIRKMLNGYFRICYQPEGVRCWERTCRVFQCRETTSTRRTAFFPSGPPSGRVTQTTGLTQFHTSRLNDLDQLLSATHQLSRLTTAALDKAQIELPQENESQFGSQAQEIRRSFLQLQNEMINLRMVSLAPILQRAVRAGRAAAREVNKQIDFEIVGSELRLDKLLADAIADPLVHLVRNAADHGIETSEARQAAGKPARGKVTIEAVRVVPDAFAWECDGAWYYRQQLPGGSAWDSLMRQGDVE